MDLFQANSYAIIFSHTLTINFLVYSLSNYLFNNFSPEPRLLYNNNNNNRNPYEALCWKKRLRFLRKMFVQFKSWSQTQTSILTLFLPSPLHHVHITAKSLTLVGLPLHCRLHYLIRTFSFRFFLGYFFHPLYEPSLTLLGTLIRAPCLGSFSLSNQETSFLDKHHNWWILQEACEWNQQIH